MLYLIKFASQDKETAGIRQCILKSIHNCEAPIFNISSFTSNKTTNKACETSNGIYYHQSNYDEAVIQLDNGVILLYSPGNDTLQPWKISEKALRLPTKCIKMTMIHPPCKITSKNEAVSFENCHVE